MVTEFRKEQIEVIQTRGQSDKHADQQLAYTPLYLFFLPFTSFFLTHVPHFCPLLHPAISSSLNILQILHNTKILFFLDLIHAHNLPLVCVAF